MMNWYSVRGNVGIWLLLGAAACGGGNFSDDFASEIQKDCTESLGCWQKPNVGDCVTKTAGATDRWSTDKQQAYVDTIVRCEGKRGCEYVTCTTSNPLAGYAGTHQAQITYQCQQTVGCKLAGGMSQEQSAVQKCIDELSATLNANPVSQLDFDGRSARCATAVGCAYNTCQ
jgi:hypothetical protein